jgi:hypothetical protein
MYFLLMISDPFGGKQPFKRAQHYVKLAQFRDPAGSPALVWIEEVLCRKVPPDLATQQEWMRQTLFGVRAAAVLLVEEVAVAAGILWPLSTEDPIDQIRPAEYRDVRAGLLWVQLTLSTAPSVLELASKESDREQSARANTAPAVKAIEVCSRPLCSNYDNLKVRCDMS